MNKFSKNEKLLTDEVVSYPCFLLSDDDTDPLAEGLADARNSIAGLFRQLPKEIKSDKFLALLDHGA